MYSEKQKEKRAKIFAAAYLVMEEKGYKSASMLEIAKRAKTSNETMYRWFNNKPGLLTAMIEENSNLTTNALLKISQGSAHPMENLKLFGTCLLEKLTSENTIALNRAACGDTTKDGQLGKLLSADNRNHFIQILKKIIENAQEKKSIYLYDSDEIAEVYVSLLVGDLQVRRMNGVINAPTTKQIQIHAERVNELILSLFGKEAKKTS